MSPFPRVALPGVDQPQADALHERLLAARLFGVQRAKSLLATGHRVYSGTVPAAEVATRRRRGKAARIARRINR